MLTINEREEQRVKYVLASKGIYDFDDHLFFHKEYWYKRVRMPPRRGIIVHDRMMSVLHYLKNDDAFCEFVTPELEKYITRWTSRCRDGRYD